MAEKKVTTTKVETKRAPKEPDLSKNDPQPREPNAERTIADAGPTVRYTPGS